MRWPNLNALGHPASVVRNASKGVKCVEMRKMCALNFAKIAPKSKHDVNCGNYYFRVIFAIFSCELSIEEKARDAPGNEEAARFKS